MKNSHNEIRTKASNIVKLSFREWCYSKLSGVRTVNNRADSLSQKRSREGRL